MKERFAKIGNKTKMIAGALALAALMAVNVQVGMNDGSTTDISLLGLEASVFAPAATATINCADKGCLALNDPECDASNVQCIWGCFLIDDIGCNLDEDTGNCVSYLCS